MSRNAVGSRIKDMSEEVKSSLLKEISAISRFGLKPTVTGQEETIVVFMGSTVHYVHHKQLKRSMVFFKVPPPHTGENIKIRLIAVKFVAFKWSQIMLQI